MADIIVIGGGHAGVEAALACARMNKDTILYSMHIDMIASMPCNPSVGGPAKGIVVREIDALGGEMGKAADATALQFKMLNTTKGPGVQCLRVQSDKIAYMRYMQNKVLHQEHLEVREMCVEKGIGRKWCCSWSVTGGWSYRALSFFDHHKWNVYEQSYFSRTYFYQTRTR